MAGAPEPKSESRMSTAENGDGGSFIDPSKNVLDLVRAESKYQDYAREATVTRNNDLRAAETRRIDQLSAAEAHRVDAMLEAETRRQDELRLAEAKANDALRGQRMTYESRLETMTTDFQKQLSAQVADYQKQIAAILAAQTSKDALLLSQAVDKLGVTTGERLSAVEKNQYLAGGKESIRDPLLTETLAGIQVTLKTLSSKSNANEGRDVGRGEIISWVAIGISIAVGIVTLFAKFNPS